MCRVLKVHRSGYYAWLREPLAARAKVNEALTLKIREFYVTYIRTHEGWLYLAALLDLHSRAVVGLSMGSRMQTSLVLDALTMAVWRRKPKDSVIIHSDQGSQFGSDEFTRWCKDNRLSPSMSRRGNYWDNAVAESFFSNLKSEQIKKRIYNTRD
jgi:putative transposase